MKSKSIFQLVILGVFGVFILIGVTVFSLGSSGRDQMVSNVSIWGFESSRNFDSILRSTGLDNDDAFNITYTQKNRETFSEDFVEALADGVGPDVLYIDHDQLYEQRNRLLNIPYESFALRSYQNTFLDGADVFRDSGGIKAFPVSVDPLVLYWNKNLFTNENVITPPQTWASYSSSLIEKFTKKEGSLTITQTALPFGVWDNVNNAKSIISALILQAGGNVTQRGAEGVFSALNSSNTNGILPAEAALNFYTDFADPQKNFYTWNRSLPNAQDYFISGKAATYIGRASEIDTIMAKNPNLQFDIAVLPQNTGSDRVTYANMTGVAISGSTRDINGSFAVLQRLISKNAVDLYSQITNSTPSRKDLLLVPDPADPFESVVYDSAIISKTWVDPSPESTDAIFADMINSILSGRKRVSESIRTAHVEISNLLR